MELVYNHVETSSDGSQLFCWRCDGINHPPFPDIEEIVDKVKDVVFRHDDVIILTEPKSGSHWVANIITLLLHRGYLDADTWRLPYVFLELHDQTTYMNAPSPRILITHLTLDLPLDHIISSGAKIVTLTRNAKDVFVSLYQQAIKLGAFKGTMKGLAELMFQGKAFAIQPWQRLKFYKELQTDFPDRCLSLTYEQLKQEPRKYVQELAQHVGVNVSDGEISRILDKTSIESMTEMVKGQQDTLLGKLGLTIYRKGEIGDWKNHFTVAFNEWFEEQSGCVYSVN